MNEKTRDIKLYTSAYEYLTTLKSKNGEPITADDINIHLKPEYDKPNDLNIIYKRLCESAQNNQGMPNSISKAIGGLSELKSVLYDFNPLEVADNYSKDDIEGFISEVKNKLDPHTLRIGEENSLWYRFAKAAIDSAHFLKSYGSAQNFYEWADSYAENEQSKIALPWLVSLEIRWVGYALAADFLKEIGYKNYGKPDVHIKDILYRLNFLEKHERSSIRENIDCMLVLDRIAKANGNTPFEVDKVLWLIGSGNFYNTKSEKQTGNKKNDFITKMQKMGL